MTVKSGCEAASGSEVRSYTLSIVDCLVIDANLTCHGGLQMETPLIQFRTQEEFVHRLERGTLIEMENEVSQLKRLNERADSYPAWIIAPMPGCQTAFATSWLLLAKNPYASASHTFPTVADRFNIDIEASIELPQGVFTLYHLAATRIQNPYEDAVEFEGEIAQKLAAFKVEVPRCQRTEDGEQVELNLMSHFQIAASVDDFSSIRLEDNTQKNISIRWDTTSQTFQAELDALYFFVTPTRFESRGPSYRARLAFKMLQNFAPETTEMTNLHSKYPHLARPTNPTYKVSPVLLKKFRDFNRDHVSAHEGLAGIKNGVYFVNGCPGAGKTEWNMVISGLIQSHHSLSGKRIRHQILFLVDINQTVSDAADRYHCLCKEAGLDVQIIRMHGWPYEIRNSEKLNQIRSQSSKSDGDAAADFTKSFLTTVGLNQCSKLERDARRAPNLDEAAWEHYEKRRHDSYPGITNLYRDVLAEADFIATTPVAASGSFAKLFRPEVIFMDEAPHARELTTLIPMAYFDPLAWIFTGDVKQTRPFVDNCVSESKAEQKGLKFNVYAEQLRLSTMARAAAAGALDRKLLVNNRAYGNLHRLPSAMFYDGEMSSGHTEEAMYPQSTLYLKGHLEKLSGRPNLAENRLVVSFVDCSEETLRSSFWNPKQHNWVVEQVKHLLEDVKFQSLTGAPGTIMIQTPYSTACRQYQGEVKQWPAEWQDRVQVLTVDKAQGNQADVVFLDMVRTTSAGFMDDPQRLNVAITRARQAEVIVMHVRMNYRQAKGCRRTKYVTQIWGDAQARRRLVSLR
ncbi:atp-dependent helicase [Trichoderma arundinaceum]|uniref:Atp-dependent helicase n=1 Tax=Trichoderma arundinaceum TaxID=490622 RepID=A0A395NMR8_TRIAR|nr:atp-dependent helicase [Trichoderma arundinaceum]